MYYWLLVNCGERHQAAMTHLKFKLSILGASEKVEISSISSAHIGKRVCSANASCSGLMMEKVLCLQM